MPHCVFYHFFAISSGCFQNCFAASSSLLQGAILIFVIAPHVLTKMPKLPKSNIQVEKSSSDEMKLRNLEIWFLNLNEK